MKTITITSEMPEHTFRVANQTLTWVGNKTYSDLDDEKMWQLFCDRMAAADAPEFPHGEFDNGYHYNQEFDYDEFTYR